MLSEIGSVLYAAVVMEAGMVTIMADLSYQGYVALTPNMNDGNDLPAMWAGFRTLVETVLLPMAELRIIHPDIRPGYDVTFNILCKLEDASGSMGKKASMKLIDYDSLVVVEQWTVPLVNGKSDGRYVRRMGQWDAATYVWWQCVFVAYVWSEKVAAGDVRKEQVLDFLMKVLWNPKTIINSSWPEWLVLLRPRAQGKITAAVVKDTLIHLGRLF
jgi:hypothetical protein